MSEQFTYKLTSEGIDDFSDKLYDHIVGQKFSEDTAIKTRLTAETVLVEWLEAAPEGSEFEVKYTKWLGTRHIVLSMQGKRIGDSDTADGASDDYFSNMLTNLDCKLERKYKNGVNVVDITLPKQPVGNVGKILIAVSLAMVLGQIIPLLLPPEYCTTLSTVYLKPLFKVIMKLLTATAVFMVFTSIIMSICSMKDISALKNIGTKLIGQIFTSALVFNTIAAIFAAMFFNVVSFDGGVNLALFSKIYGLLLAVIPGDLLSPFIHAHTLQIVFLAICFGCAMLVLGDEVSGVKHNVMQLNRIISYIVSCIVKALPVMVFLGILTMCLQGDISKLADTWKLFAAEAVCFLVIYFGHAAYTCYTCGLNFFSHLKVCMPTTLLAITTCNQIACLPSIERATKEHYKVDKNVVDFALPIALIFSKRASAVHNMMLVFTFSEICGNSLSVSQIVIMVISSIILTFSTPPVPGGAIAILSMFMAQFGLPESAVAVAISIDFISNMQRSAVNVTARINDILILNSKLK